MFLRSSYAKYIHWNETRPLLTKCATAGVLMGLGDYLCQSIEKSKSAILSPSSSLAPLLIP